MIIYIKVIYIYSLKKTEKYNKICKVFGQCNCMWLLLSLLESSVDILSYEEEYFSYQETM